MNDPSVRQGGKRDENENEVQEDETLNKTFGEEGTNKTESKPDPSAKPSDVPGAGKHMEPSPFVR